MQQMTDVRRPDSTIFVCGKNCKGKKYDYEQKYHHPESNWVGPGRSLHSGY